MSQLFIEELNIPRPDLDLGVGSGSHSVQTAEIMRRFEPVLLERRPGLVVVVGDVNSTTACTLVAAKMEVPVAHVEAGLRSFDRKMPEEINRLVTDALADLLFVSEPSGLENLRREGVPSEKVHFVGNVMIDTLLRHRERTLTLPTLRNLGLEGRHVLVTLHRPSNVDDPVFLGALLEALAELARELPVLFPVHPRTRERIASARLDRLPSLANGRIRTMEPLGYLEFLGLLSRCTLAITDSGGIQEETTVLGVPCLTLRDNTERPATVEWGTNRLVGRNAPAMLSAARDILSRGGPSGTTPELWDGHAAERIAITIQRFLGHRSAKPDMTRFG